MKNTIKLSMILAAMTLVGCAAAYMPPTTIAQTNITKTDFDKTQVMTAAKRALISQGFTITSFDNDAGIISTNLRDYRLRPQVADCGKTMGLDYLLDNRVNTKLGYGVIVDAGKFEVKANLEGNFKVGDASQDITLTCVSRGNLEQDLTTKILAEIK